MAKSPPDEPPGGTNRDRFMLTISCPTAALVTIALAVIGAILIVNGFDPSFLATLIKGRP